MRVFPRWPIPILKLLVAGWMLSACAFAPLLADVKVAPAVISPNADRTDDVTHIAYRIGRPATVSIYFVDAQGQRYYFRNAQRRSPGRYTVYWGGVINDPQVRVVGGKAMLVESRVLPDGVYTWTVEAVDDSGRTAQVSGQITLKDADASLPELHNFTVVPQVFRPNQDGLRDDWVSIAYYLTKKAERVQVYLKPAGRKPNEPDIKYPIAEKPYATVVEAGAAGYHEYRYEGGVDQGAEPPPDGEYVIYGEAEDRVGNRVVVSSTLTIVEGGKPRAEVAGGEIAWRGAMNRELSVALGQSFCFTATVVNIGPVPIRTAGPWPGQSFKFSENYNTLAARGGEESWYQQAGVWRFGVNFDTTGVDFPFRWAIGRKEDLEERLIDGRPQYYLLPGRRGQVFGCITLDQKPPVGTTFWWGGLIHEFVEVANNYIERIVVAVGVP
ncbi:MAG: hypothetical protein FJ011_01335 [Chloroflexi bacterium]|nr:hypothetical protein [Chloroflexota bacterium]